MTLTKRDLVIRISDETGLGQQQVFDVVQKTLDYIAEALAKGDVKAARAQYRETVSTLDKSVQKGILHGNTVSRYKSRLNARLKALATAKA